MSASSICVRCHRPLRDADSIKAGMGPVCRDKAGRAFCGELFGGTPVLNDVGSLNEVGLVCRRLADGRLACNVPHVVVYHSPSGFDCGYTGSGPAELALNVMHAILPPAREIDGDAPRWRAFQGMSKVVVSGLAERLHQGFKFKFVATMNPSGGRVPIEEIRAWIDEQVSR